MKKLIALILTLIFAVSCFCACDGDVGGNSNDSTENVSSSIDENISSSTTTETSSASEAPQSSDQNPIVSCTFDVSKAKTQFLINEAFSAGEITAVATYKNGLVLNLKTVNLTVDSSKFVSGTAGTYDIKVNLKAFSESYSVTVSNPSSCEFDFTDVTKIYALKQDFDSANIKVKGVLNADNKVDVPSAFVNVDSESFDPNTAGEYTIKVSAYGFEDSFKVNVYTPSAVTIDTTAVKRVYVQNQAFKADGVTAEATVNGNVKIDINPSLITVNSSAYVATAPGKYNITFSYLTFNEAISAVVLTLPTVTNNEIKIKVDDNMENSLLGTCDASGALLLDGPTTAIDVMTAGAYADTVIKKIYFAAGTYNEKINLKIPNVHFIGENAATTILTYGLCSTTGGGTDRSSSYYVTGEGFVASNVTFENSYDYLNGKEAAKQAVALTIQADKGVFNNCIFLGWQDTLQIKSGRHYFNACTIKGCTDFIFGNNPTAYFNKCDIVSLDRNSNSNCLTAMKGNNGNNDVAVTTYGLVFKACTLTKEGNVTETSLGRPWRKNATVAFINCEMGAHISNGVVGTDDGLERYQTMSGGTDASGKTIVNQPKDAQFVEYGNTGDGALSAGTTDFTMLDAATAANYTYANIFAAKNGGVVYAAAWDIEAAMTALGFTIA